MNSFHIAQFAKTIGLENKISKKDADIVIKKLSVSNLRMFLEKLKTEQEKKMVTVLTNEMLTGKEKKQVQDFFAGKDVVFEVDKAVGAGMKIKTYDMIYDLSLKGSISRIAQNLE